MKINVLGHDYEISFDKSVTELDSYGETNFPAQKITIPFDLATQNKEASIVHEMLEILNYHLQLNLDHDKIMALESGVFQVLKNNDFQIIRKELAKKNGK